jgi:predicted metalloendopeptidase
MDEPAIDKAGDKPIVPMIDAINGVASKAALAPVVARLQSAGVSVFFRFGVDPDFEDSKVNIADADQGGLGLPDKSYYERPKDEATRQKYVEHVTKMFELTGIPHDQAAERAKAVMAIETALAAASLERVARRDPHKTHHKETLADFEQLTPDFDFKAYLAAMHASAFTKMNVAVPEFFTGLNAVLDKTSLEDLKSYLEWHLISTYANTLSKPFVDEAFDFDGKFLTGAKELQPRWKRWVMCWARSMCSERLRVHRRKRLRNW